MSAAPTPAEVALNRLRWRLDKPAALVAVGGRHDGDGWRILLLQGGETLAALDPAQAREVAQDMLGLADLFEGRAQL